MGGAGRGFRGHGGGFAAQGEDHHAKMLLDLEDAFSGATRQLTLRVPKLTALVTDLQEEMDRLRARLARGAAG